MVTRPVYLDYNATNPLHPDVFEAMVPWFLDNHGNASSRTHWHGQQARDAVERSRAAIALHFGVPAEDVVFTSGATESNNLAIMGLVSYAEKTGKKHVVSTAIEHSAVLEPLRSLQKKGFEVDLAPVCPGGFVDPDSIRKRIRDDTLLVSVMHANNETGVVQPVEEISGITEAAGVFFHTDAAQSFGKEVPTLETLNFSFASISAHKICGPKGIGALILRRRRATQRILEPILFGGGQERKLRPGTLPVPLIVGFGKAAQLARTEWRDRADQALTLRNALLEGLATIGATPNGDINLVQPHIVNFSIPDVDSEAFMLAARQLVSVSNGSACTSSSYSPSHVLAAMGLDEDRIASSIRFSWGPGVESIPVAEVLAVIRALKGVQTDDDSREVPQTLGQL
jgi:cysteine desulfurase